MIGAAAFSDHHCPGRAHTREHFGFIDEARMRDFPDPPDERPSTDGLTGARRRHLAAW
ncbi:MAG TPA: hypothetical protein VK524_22315 [Polyangiaceae bacterium]|nr:hypothetical protein [Polyangiaceae bacterium]